MKTARERVFGAKVYIERAFALMLVLWGLSMGSVAEGESITIKTGPAGDGGGGSSPLAVSRVEPSDWQLTWVSDGGFEANLSVIPGALVGHRFREENYYLSLGGGVLSDVNGIGPGVYAALGYITGDEKKGWHLTIDYTQTVGYAPSRHRMISPDSLRYGVIWEW